ncbi:MAG: hypothetical protein QNJ46_31735 [Leptolyngbyaceae cyanobacterium MO_188.B28]|nr:hypothetical protein [Leptolyngbyaceae cyanobacterium MO_188.B28]
MSAASNKPGPTSYAFTFVCQKGELEGLALILAASLKRSLKCKYELIAAVPSPTDKWGELSKETYHLLAQMSVRIEYITNPISGEKQGDFLTNKIYCFKIPTTMDKLVFVDSDILCLREFRGDVLLDAPFSAAPTFLATGQNWDKVYETMGLPFPKTTMKALFSEDLQPPYFNSGFVAVDAQLAEELAGTWLDCFHHLDESGILTNNLYFREQMSLAVAVIKMGLQYNVLDENYNFWVRARPLDVKALPYFLHYTWPNPPIYNQPVLKSLVRSLIAEYPSMKQFLVQSRWKYYLRPDFIVSLNRTMFYANKQFKQLIANLTKYTLHG